MRAYVGDQAYDCTPTRVQFGQLQQQLLPVARYAVLGENSKWKLVSYDEFVKEHGGPKFLRSGIVELLAGACSIIHMGSDDLLHGMKKLCRPMILARSNASCVYSATEKLFGCLSKSSLAKLGARITFGFMSEVSCKRYGCGPAYGSLYNLHTLYTMCAVLLYVY